MQGLLGTLYEAERYWMVDKTIPKILEDVLMGFGVTPSEVKECFEMGMSPKEIYPMVKKG